MIGDEEQIISGLQEGSQIDILISRDNVLMNIKATMGVYERPSYKLSFENKQNALGEYWLR